MEHSGTSELERSGSETRSRESILVVDDHPQMRKMLVGLIKDKIKAKCCFEIDSVEIVTTNIDRERVDFALLNISADPCGGRKTAELLKLRCPLLPVMAVSVSGIDGIDESGTSDISGEQIETILSGIRYMQSLIRSGMSGFTIFVKT
jgi:DNA-binding NarL/FixJ family response regulator